jgi:E3 ubiquitin-protein ligase UBR4
MKQSKWQFLLISRYDVPQYGQKAAQYIDLIGYCLIKSINNTQNLSKYLHLIQDLYFRANNMLKTHSNSFLYQTISNYIEFDGFYLGMSLN